MSADAIESAPGVYASLAELVLLQRVGLVNAGFALAILTCGVLGPIARWRQWTLPVAPERGRWRTLD